MPKKLIKIVNKQIKICRQLGVVLIINDKIDLNGIRIFKGNE